MTTRTAKRHAVFTVDQEYRLKCSDLQYLFVECWPIDRRCRDSRMSESTSMALHDGYNVVVAVNSSNMLYRMFGVRYPAVCVGAIENSWRCSHRQTTATFPASTANRGNVGHRQLQLKLLSSARRRSTIGAMLRSLPSIDDGSPISVMSPSMRHLLVRCRRDLSVGAWRQQNCFQKLLKNVLQLSADHG